MNRTLRTVAIILVLVVFVWLFLLTTEQIAPGVLNINPTPTPVCNSSNDPDSPYPPCDF